MGCGELFLKSASSTFTGYFLIVSIAFTVYGLMSTYLLLITNTEQVLEEEYVCVSSMALVLFGILLLVFIILGCCAVCREIPCCMETYSIFLAILAAAQIALGIFCLVKFKAGDARFAETIKDEITGMFLNYEKSYVDMDNVQDWMSCCGINGPSDWLMNNLTIPSSCCQDGDACAIENPAAVHEDGCYTTVLHFILGTNYIIGWSLVIVGITEIIAAMLGVSLSCAFWRNRNMVWM